MVSVLHNIYLTFFFISRFQLGNALVYYTFLYSSTCFEPYCAHHQEAPLYIHSIWFFMCHSVNNRGIQYKISLKLCKLSLKYVHCSTKCGFCYFILRTIYIILKIILKKFYTKSLNCFQSDT